jgi:hypothetical protein
MPEIANTELIEASITINHPSGVRSANPEVPASRVGPSKATIAEANTMIGAK